MLLFYRGWGGPQACLLQCFLVSTNFFVATAPENRVRPSAALCCCTRSVAHAAPSLERGGPSEKGEGKPEGLTKKNGYT